MVIAIVSSNLSGPVIQMILSSISDRCINTIQWAALHFHILIQSKGLNWIVVEQYIIGASRKEWLKWENIDMSSKDKWFQSSLKLVFWIKTQMKPVTDLNYYYIIWH